MCSSRTAREDKRPLQTRAIPAEDSSDERKKPNRERVSIEGIGSSKNSAPTEAAKNDARRGDGSLELPKKVVVILLDTLRPDYLGFYGFRYETAPFLARLAKQATVFLNAFSTSSWTAPSVASLFTSLYPPQHGVTMGYRVQLGRNAEIEGTERPKLTLKSIPEALTTLPQKLAELGYQTFGLSANINIGKELGFARGFKVFEKKTRATADYFLKKVEEWKPQLDGAERYFLYLHLNDVHHPYHKREEFYRTSLQGRDKNQPAERYRSEIGYADHYLEKIYDLLELERDSVIIVLSDHGEEFWDHGSQGHGPTLHRELNRILLMVHGPDLGLQKGRIAQNVSINDVYPTLVELLGHRLPTVFEGISLVPLLRRGGGAKELFQQLEERVVFAHRVYSTRANLAIWSVVQNEWRLIDYWGERTKLFNDKDDPEELYDVKLKRVGHAKKLIERMEQFKDRMRRAPLHNLREKEIETDKNLLTQLKSLGYME